MQTKLTLSLLRPLHPLRTKRLIGKRERVLPTAKGARWEFPLLRLQELFREDVLHHLDVRWNTGNVFTIVVADIGPDGVLYCCDDGQRIVGARAAIFDISLKHGLIVRVQLEPTRQ
ncbi:hypothetical protein HY491_01345 [Candidatus Woesearchaeota archaeon]|nr:hypothetical protein [Candidatus Woesearchaeota archaeon]